MSESSNLPLPDQLYAVREQIEQLKQREAEIRTRLIDNKELREGASWIAEVKDVTTKRTDLKELRHFHPTLVDEYSHPVTVTHVVLSGITTDGEIINKRAMKKVLADE